MIAAARRRGARCLLLMLATAWFGAGWATAAERESVETLSSPVASGAAGSSEGALALAAVLASAELHFPLLQVADLERDVRQGELESRRGAFDARFGASGDVRPAGFYQNQGAEAEFEQQTRLWGSRFYAGYRYGGGDFPSYKGADLTDGAGEVRGGLTVPLLRGGAVDPMRAALERGEIGVALVGPEVELRRIDVRRDASRTYWDWVARGLALDVAEHLLDMAVGRQAQIEGRVRKGAEPEIDLVDNERLIVDRRLRLRGVQRDFEKASILLSLFLRDDFGNPVRVLPERLPAGFPEETRLERDRVSEDVEHARTRHPLVQKLELDRERWEVDEALARNDMLPDIDLDFTASQDFGSDAPGIDTSGKLSSAPRSETEVFARIRFELPIQRREAKGRLAVARSRVAQVDQRMRFQRERLVAELQRAVVELDAAYDQTLEARRNRELAEQMRRAEERKFTLGLSNLIDVNIRETQAASAADKLIEAQAAYYVAMADYEAAAARPVAVEGPVAAAAAPATPVPSSLGEGDPRRARTSG